MTAYELFERVYKHYMGQFIRHIVHTADKNAAKEYARQSFVGILGEHCIDYAGCSGISLSYGVYFDDGIDADTVGMEVGTNSAVYDVDMIIANKTLGNIEHLSSIEVLAGYWLCFHDGHTDDWMLIHYVSKSEAKDAYKSLYMRYFRHQDWFWIVKV